MGANVEWDIVLRREHFVFGPILSRVREMGLVFRIEVMSAFDDWQYRNETPIDLSSFDIETSLLFQERFTLIQFVVNDIWRGTLITSCEGDCIELSFSFPLEDVMKIDSVGGSDPIQHFYEQLAKRIDMWCEQDWWRERLIAVSIGIEYSVEFSADLYAMLQEDNGAERWIFPKEAVANLNVEKFKREEKENTVLFVCRQPYHEA